MGNALIFFALPFVPDKLITIAVFGVRYIERQSSISIHLASLIKIFPVLRPIALGVGFALFDIAHIATCGDQAKMLWVLLALPLGSLKFMVFCSRVALFVVLASFCLMFDVALSTVLSNALRVRFPLFLRIPGYAFLTPTFVAVSSPAALMEFAIRFWMGAACANFIGHVLYNILTASQAYFR